MGLDKVMVSLFLGGHISSFNTYSGSMYLPVVNPGVQGNNFVVLGRGRLSGRQRYSGRTSTS